MTDHLKSNSNVTIISDGTATGTKVLVGDQLLKNVTRVEISPVLPGGILTAKLTVSAPMLCAAIGKADIVCDDPETAEQIRQVLQAYAAEGGNA